MSNQCLVKPQKSMIYLILISSAYVTYDNFICMYDLGYGLSMKNGGDFILHHVVGLIGALAVLVAGRQNVALSCSQLISEWTSFPMNFRWRMLKHGQADSIFYIPVNFIFLLSYIIFRIVAMGMLLVRTWQIMQVVDIF